MGVLYTVCLTIDKDAYVFKTSSLVNLKDKKGELKYKKRSNVAQIKCKSEHLTYLTENGEVHQMFGEKNCDQIYQK